VRSVAVGSDAVVVEVRGWWRPAVLVKFPAAIHAFMAAFEAGCYPCLLPPSDPASAEAERTRE